MPRRPTPPTVRIRKVPNRKSPYSVYYYVNRKPVYFGFYARKSGDGGAEQARDREQLRLDRAFYLTTPEGQYTAKFDAHIEDFIDYQNKIENSPATVTFYREKLGYLAKRFGSLSFGDLTRENVRTAIKAPGNSPASERCELRALSAYMNWSHARPVPLGPPSFTRFVALENPRAKLHKNFYTVAEAALLLYRCMDDWRRVPMALKLFAGIRTAELGRMDAALVDTRDHAIYMPEGIAKTAGHMESLPPVLWDWLPKRLWRGPICAERVNDKLQPRRPDAVSKNIKHDADFSEAKRTPTRRTYATYSSNHYGCEATRKNLRHDGDLTTMEKHYIGCVVMRRGRPYIATKHNSALYFRLTPRVVRAFGLLYDAEQRRRRAVT